MDPGNQAGLATSPHNQPCLFATLSAACQFSTERSMKCWSSAPAPAAAGSPKNSPSRAWKCSCSKPDRRGSPRAISPSMSGRTAEVTAASAIRSACCETQPVQRLCYACDEYSHQFFVNDREHPYTFPADKPFMWIRGRQVGGKTFCWARVSYRYSDYEFQAAAATATARTGPSATKNSSPITTRSRVTSA